MKNSYDTLFTETIEVKIHTYHDYNHSCVNEATFKVSEGNPMAVCIHAINCDRSKQAGHDSNYIYYKIGEEIPVEKLFIIYYKQKGE